MSDTVERLRRENTSLTLDRFKWMFCPSLSVVLLDPMNYHNSFFAIRCDKAKSGFNVFKGITKVNESVMVAGGEEGIVVADIEKRELLRADGMDLSGMEHDEIVDLSVEGDRWEGDVVDEKPCGWGVLFDKDNNKVYEGFRVGEMNVCYGRCFYADIESVEYAGEWCEGRRWRKGTQYDRNGGVVYEGEWVNDVHVKTEVVITPGLETFHNHIEVLRVSSGCCNGEEWSVLNMGLMGCLKSVVVENECFVNVSELKLSGMKRLESVVIGESCFTKHKHGSGRDMDRKFCLKNCPKLKSLKTGDSSFSDYGVIELENVDGLEVIEMGEMAFYSASLRLKSASWASG